MASTKLEQIKQDPDPERRLVRLTDYINHGSAVLEQARLARLAAVRDARSQGLTWRQIASDSGLSEQYLRRATSAGYTKQADLFDTNPVAIRWETAAVLAPHGNKQADQ